MTEICLSSHLVASEPCKVGHTVTSCIGLQDNQDAVASAGGIKALVKLLDGGPASPGTAAACWAVVEVATAHPANQDAFRAAGGVAKLVKLLEGAHGLGISTAALSAVAAVAQGSVPNKTELHQHGTSCLIMFVKIYGAVLCFRA